MPSFSALYLDFLQARQSQRRYKAAPLTAAD
jgi:hypothetical protein